MSELEPQSGDGLESRESVPVGLPVVSGWFVRAGGEGADVGRAWAQRAGAVACWPSGRVTLERRFVKPPGSGRVREFVLAGTAGQETLGGPKVAKAELDRLVAPLRAAQLMAAVDEEGDRPPWTLDGLSDVAELAELSDLAPEGVFALGGYLDEIIDVLGAVEDGSILSLLMATPGDLDGVAETQQAPPSGEGTVGMRTPVISAQRRPVRFRLRLAGTQSLPPSILALAGALALGPTESAGRGWRRAAGPVQQAAARRAVDSLATEAWWSLGPTDDELCSSTVAAATLMSLRARSDALDHLPVAMAPVASPEALGAPVGRVADRSGALVMQRLPWRARNRGTYCAGATGAGKSTLLSAGLVAADLQAGRSVVVLDPHGPMSDEVLGIVPAERLDDVLVIDPLDPDGAALDLIPPPDVEDPHRTATRISDAIEELHDPGQHKQIVGPRLIQAVQMAVIALLDQASPDHPGRSPVIADVERMIAERSFRSTIVPHVRDQRVREFWKSWDTQTDFHQSEVLMYMTSKFTPLTSGPLRNALAEPARYRFEEVIRARGIVVCQIPIGELGIRSSNFVGRLILARLLDALAATGRTAEPCEVSVVIDEAQTLADGQVIERFYSQARKWGAAVAAANQAPTALGAHTLQSVLSNSANLFLFRLPPSQAMHFSEQLPDAIERLPNLPDFHAVGRIGGSGKPFVMQGLKPVEPDPDVAREARRRSRERYGRKSGGTHVSLEGEEQAGGTVWPQRAGKPAPPSQDELDRLAQAFEKRARTESTGRQHAIHVSIRDHVWVRPDAGRLLIGIAAGIARVLDPSASIKPVPVGSRVHQGEPLARVRVGDRFLFVHSPASGTLLELNIEVFDQIASAGRPPVGDGSWIAALKPSDWERESAALLCGAQGFRFYAHHLTKSEESGADLLEDIR